MRFQISFVGFEKKWVGYKAPLIIPDNRRLFLANGCDIWFKGFLYPKHYLILWSNSETSSKITPIFEILYLVH